jgi:transposase
MEQEEEREGAIALAGGEPARVQALLLRGENVALRGEVGVLRERVEELERRINRDPTNSNEPPSSASPASRAERRRKARAAFKNSMRATGAQPGHPGKRREPVPPERVDERREHPPAECACGHRFTGEEERVGDPVTHQQWELPPIRPYVIEHARLRLCCPECQQATLARLPGAGLSEFGPRLEAHIAMFAGVYRLSRRDTRDVVANIFGIPISLGSIDAQIARMSVILADPWEELRRAVRRADAVHMDETTWRLCGAQQWLWVAATSLVACYRIDPSRSQKAAKALIGEDFGGFAITDRYAGYHFLEVLQQQLCWAHVIRQLIEVSERKGPAGAFGKDLVNLARSVIAAHRQFLCEEHDPQWLAEALAPLRRRIQERLKDCTTCGHQRTERFARGLLEEYAALWTFAEHTHLQIDPTNNAAELAVRHAVLMRKIQGGTQSDRGSRWIERIQSARETCRLQGQPILHWLIGAATAAHAGLPIPTLLPAAQGP